MKGILPLMFMITVLFSSCAVVGGIFKAGVWTGILLVVVVIGIIIWLVSRRSGKS